MKFGLFLCLSAIAFAANYSTTTFSAENILITTISGIVKTKDEVLPCIDIDPMFMESSTAGDEWKRGGPIYKDYLDKDTHRFNNFFDTLNIDGKINVSLGVEFEEYSNENTETRVSLNPYDIEATWHDGHILTLRAKAVDGKSDDNLKRPQVDVYLPAHTLKAVNVWNGGSVAGAYKASCETIALNVYGSGYISGDFRAQRIEVNIIESGSVLISGIADQLTAKITGKGHLDSSHLIVSNVNVTDLGISQRSLVRIDRKSPFNRFVVDDKSFKVEKKSGFEHSVQIVGPTNLVGLVELDYEKDKEDGLTVLNIRNPHQIPFGAVKVYITCPPLGFKLKQEYKVRIEDGEPVYKLPNGGMYTYTRNVTKFMMGDGKMRSRNTSCSPFTSIKVDGAVIVEVVKAERYSILAHGNRNLLVFLTTQVSNNQLLINVREGVAYSAKEKLKVIVSVPPDGLPISGIETNGCASVKIGNSIPCESIISLKATEYSKIEGEFKCRDINAWIYDRGSMILSGSCEDLCVTWAIGAYLDISRLESESFETKRI